MSPYETFVLFGSTGDLAVKKIFPALEALYLEGKLSSIKKIIATGRRDFTSTDFISYIEKINGTPYNDFFKTIIEYVYTDIDTGIGYDMIKASLDGEALVYISLAPKHTRFVIEGLRRENIIGRDVDSGRAKGKVLIEKPFGTDEKSACVLNDALVSFLDESQIGRVDHYLGKETIQALMDMRENESGFNEFLHADLLAKIEISLFEEKGIDGRGASYDGVGAFRDVGQNHMLEMLAVVSAELPGVSEEKITGTMWQYARAQALSHLLSPVHTCENSRRGQYEGYMAEQGVGAASETETAFEVSTTFAGGPLAQVPLFLRSGKKMHESSVSIKLSFKDVYDTHPNVPEYIVYSVQPERYILTKDREGNVTRFEIPPAGDAYATVILSALMGSTREFVGTEEIKNLWKYSDKVVACWNAVPLEIYGPDKPFFKREA